MKLVTLCSLPTAKKRAPIVRAARVGLHHKSHKIHSTMEGIASLFVAYETHHPLFALVSVLWAALDFYCLLDPKLKEGAA